MVVDIDGMVVVEGFQNLGFDFGTSLAVVIGVWQFEGILNFGSGIAACAFEQHPHGSFDRVWGNDDGR